MFAKSAWKLIFVFLTFSAGALAFGEDMFLHMSMESYKVSVNDGEFSVTARFQTAKGQDTLCSFTSGSGIETLRYSTEITLSEYPRPLIATLWGHGAHGEAMRVFDPRKAKNCLLKTFTSGWPGTYELDGHSIKAEVYKDEGPIEQKWRPLKSKN